MQKKLKNLIVLVFVFLPPIIVAAIAIGELPNFLPFQSALPSKDHWVYWPCFLIWNLCLSNLVVLFPFAIRHFLTLGSRVGYWVAAKQCGKEIWDGAWWRINNPFTFVHRNTKDL